VDLKDPAVPALHFQIKHPLTFRTGAFPAGLVPVMISRAKGIYVLRTAQDLPAWILIFPEV
jgi:hypothetical protein